MCQIHICNNHSSHLLSYSIVIIQVGAALLYHMQSYEPYSELVGH